MRHQSGTGRAACVNVMLVGKSSIVQDTILLFARQRFSLTVRHARPNLKAALDVALEEAKQPLDRVHVSAAASALH